MIFLGGNCGKAEAGLFVKLCTQCTPCDAPHDAKKDSLWFYGQLCFVTVLTSALVVIVTLFSLSHCKCIANSRLLNRHGV